MYETRPCTHFPELGPAWRSWHDIAGAIDARLAATTDGPAVLALECYPGVDLSELERGILPLLSPSLVLHADDYSWSAERVQARIADTITNDRVFGVMSHYTIDQFFDDERLEAAHTAVAGAHGLVVVMGFGATLLCKPDLVVYADLTRWEIQCRHRRGMPNWKSDNDGEDALRKFKRSYFFEWRLADRLKQAVMPTADLVLDTNRPNDPSMVDGATCRKALARLSARPFRLVPYFDQSVWGGHWMQEHFGLDPEAPNFGWAFDGVPEENSLLMDFGGIEVEVPALDLVFFHPDELLGPKVHARFGTEFPIRFDYLDTMGGGNLSLQVHPLTEYIRDRFGMAYTQDESYYILDAMAGSHVYLGVRTGVNKDDMVRDLERAAAGEIRFPDEAYVNRLPVDKHDHVHIPAGTVHCGGAGTVILEISATPYVFTFKLWDWGRVGLDGIPRPTHVEHGARNILTSRDTELCATRLIDRAADPHQNLSSQEGVVEEHTGLNELEFIETRRHWFTRSARLECHDSVNVLNLVEGGSARVESVDRSFEPFPVNYGETFIVPARVGTYRITNTSEADRRIAVIQAYVRN